jgi:hypothetical protein
MRVLINKCRAKKPQSIFFLEFRPAQREEGHCNQAGTEFRPNDQHQAALHNLSLSLSLSLSL